MNGSRRNIQDVLYEAPGPRARRVTRIATVLSLALIFVLLVLVIRRFYLEGQLDEKYWALFARWTTWRYLGQGLLGTLRAALMAGAVAFALAFLLMISRISPILPLKAAAVALIEFTRGVPTLLFIYFFFLVAPNLGVTLPAFWKITLPVAISASGLVAEALRSGVNAVPKGQKEAAMALGMRNRTIFLRIVLPQAIRFVIPALIAELVIVVKDTTFAYIVTFPDLMQNAKVLVSNHDALLSVYLVVAVLYIMINYLINRASIAAGRRRNRVLAAAKEI